MLVLIVFLLLALNAGQNQSQTTDNKAQTHAATQSSPSPSPDIQQIPTPEGQTTPNRKSETSTLEDKPFLSHGEWVMAILTGIYVLLTGIYVFVSARTLTAIKRQEKANATQFTLQLAEATKSAEAAERAAKAASLNAQAVINSERAWVLFKVKRYGDTAHQIEFSNHGKTPARIIAVHFQTAFVNMPRGELPKIPDYGLDTRFSHVRALAPDDPWEHFEYQVRLSPTELTQQGFDNVIHGRQRLFMWGRIKYQSVVGSDDIYESGFCFFYSTQLREFIPGGPSRYTYYT